MGKKIKVLTFGWEFPPHISGGLGTACYGLTRSLLKQGTEVLFVVPRARGDEDIRLISASEVIIPSAVISRAPGTSIQEGPSLPAMKAMQVIAVTSAIRPYSAPDTFHAQSLSEWSYSMTEDRTEAMTPHRSGAAGVRYLFSGTYGPNLLQEVVRYGEIGGVIAGEHDFDVIHAHDWLTFPAGISAKNVSGKPLVIHVHATEYDRADSHNVDARVLAIEKKGMREADRIVAVSEWTRKILVTRYGVANEKVTVVHNGVTAGKRVLPKSRFPLGKNMVTFLGRVTHQKGPQYFVEAARRVLEKFPDTHFVVAGSGDLLPSIINRVAALRLSSRFHFTGFLSGAQVDQVWALSDVYVMPSVSEPFGIAPLEAIQSGVPVILSRQSGVCEVIPHAIKTDFWDVDVLAGAICSVLKHKSLARTLKKQGRELLKDISWDSSARKLNHLFHEITAERN